MSENPGAYNEARDRIREKKEKETILVESQKEEFEKTKNILRKKKGLDVHELRRRIETGNSLDLLKSEIKNALTEGTISRDTYDRVIASIDNETNNEIEIGMIDPDKLPFSQNKLAKYLENQPLGENIGTDIVGFLYGFVIQGSAILVIIAWKILTDFLFLPRDIYNNFLKQ
ncbi:hypothetical protein K2X92_02610 [Candidatus Gracilibacteria bacterium]|nr:hypothetical protein [Candidatus Gracilibacteria bacterium]